MTGTRNVLPGLRRLVGEPLVHFVLLGLLIFAADRIRPRADDAADRRITVTGPRIAQLRGAWTAQKGRPPTEAELNGLIDEFVREEMLYREAMSLGLDEGDTIIRRRLAQKMTFLFADLAGVEEPDEARLKAWFDDHRERYEVPARYSFSHIYFNPERHGEQTGAAVEAARAGLAQRPESWRRLGDPFMPARDYAERTRTDIARLFGEGFADAVAAAGEGHWSGPVRSALGVHLIRLEGRSPARQAEFNEVRNRVLTDYREAAREKAQREFMDRLAARYRVTIESGSP